MKKLEAVSTLFIFFLFFSCSNDLENLSIGTAYDDTLRIRFQEYFEDITWTEELEPDLLSQRKKLDETMFAQRSLETPEGASVVHVPEGDNVYPSIANFGSLNIGSLPAGLRRMMDSFCQDLLNVSRNKSQVGLYSSLATRMLPGRSYMLSIYLHDTVSYPAAQSFYLGKPSQQKSSWEIPVLFVAEGGRWTVIVYACIQDEQWKVEQIRYGDFVYE